VSTRSSVVTRSLGNTVAVSRVETPRPHGATDGSLERIALQGGALSAESIEGDATGTVAGGSTIRFAGHEVPGGAPFVLTYAFADGGFRRTVTGGSAPSDVRCAHEPQPPAPTACAVPDAAGHMIHAVEPSYSAEAIAQHLSGDVSVIVTLDDRSQVLWTRILRSDSAALDGEAERAARESTYAVTVKNCRPVAGEYIFAVSFRYGRR
jgi:hypothetical protein